MDPRLVACAVVALLAGCLGGPPTAPSEDDGAAPQPEAPHVDGFVLLDERFTAAIGVPASFPVQVPSEARQVVLDLTQFSGAIPNLRVELTGCGAADAPGTAGLQTIALCDDPTDGPATFTVSVRTGLPAGSGTVVLRADRF